MSYIKLAEIFEANKVALAEQLKGLSLPQDAQKVQVIVANYLNSLFESDGVYRQNLNQSEDYILQSALQLLQAQQNISAEIIKSVKSTSGSSTSTSTDPTQKSATQQYSPVIGAGVGAIAGSLLGTWAAVCGAIAGTAIAIYCTSKSSTKSTSTTRTTSTATVRTINIDVFTSIVGKVCESIDNLMQTYRVQVKRIENAYSQSEKPSLLDECSALFTQIGNLSKAIEANKEATPTKVINAMEMLSESLENYGMTIKDGKVVTE